MDIIKFKINNTRKEWNNLFKKCCDNNLNDYLIQINTKLEYKDELTNLIYVMLLVDLNYNVELIIEKESNLKWDYNNFKYEVISCFSMINKSNLSIFLKFNNNIEKITNHTPKEIHFITRLPFLFFDNESIKQLKLNYEEEFAKKIYNDFDCNKDNSSYFFDFYIYQFLNVINKKNKIEDIFIKYINKFFKNNTKLNLFFLILIYSGFYKNNMNIKINDLIRKIYDFGEGLYQIIENSIMHSQGKIAYVAIELINLKYSNNIKRENYVSDQNKFINKKLYYMENYNFNLSNDCYVSIKVFDRAYNTNKRINYGIVKTAELKKECTLYEYFNVLAKNQSQDRSNEEIDFKNKDDKIYEKYGLMIFLDSINKLNTMVKINSCDDSIDINVFKNKIYLNDNERLYITEYNFAIPIVTDYETVSNTINKLVNCENYELMDLNLEYSIKQGRILPYFNNFEKQYKVIKNYNYLKEKTNFLQENVIPMINISSNDDIEIVLKILANMAYSKILNNNRSNFLAIINLEMDVMNCKHCIKKIFIFYKILIIKMENLLNKQNIKIKQEQIQVCLYNKNNEEYKYISILCGYNWPTVINTFVNNLLYNNEFLNNEFFDIYIDYQELINQTYEKDEIRIFPFELVCLDNRFLFKECIEKIIDNTKIPYANVMLQSNKKLINFYEAEFIFRSIYLCKRIAVSIIDDLNKNHKIELENKNIYLIGYGNYSHLICENIDKYLGEDKPIKIIYFKNFNMLSHMDESINTTNNYYIGIVPISSTLNVIHNMNRFLNFKIKNEKSASFINVVYNVLNVSLDNSIRLKTEKNWNSLKELEDFPNTNINIMCQRIENSVPKLILPISNVDITSTVHQEISIKPIYKDEDNQLDLKLKKFKYLKDCISYGHYQIKDRHYLYYINYDKIINNKSIEKEIEKELKSIKINNLSLNIVVTPLSENINSFLKIIEQKVFQGNMIIIQIDREMYRENFIRKYSHIAQKIKTILEVSVYTKIDFYYVDMTVYSGKTIQRAKELIHSLFDVIGNKELSHRLNPYIFNKIFLLINRSSDNTIETIIGRKENVYSFIDLNCPTFDMNGMTCPDCKISKNYETIINLIDNEKYKKDFEKTKKKHEIIKVDNDLLLDYNDESLMRLMINHCILKNKDYIFKIISSLKTKNLNEIYGYLEKIKETIKKEILKFFNSFNNEVKYDNMFEKCFIKVITRPTITNYSLLKKLSYIYLRVYLRKYFYNMDNKMLILIFNRMSYLGSGYLNLKKERLKILIENKFRKINNSKKKEKYIKKLEYELDKYSYFEYIYSEGIIR